MGDPHSFQAALRFVQRCSGAIPGIPIAIMCNGASRDNRQTQRQFPIENPGKCETNWDLWLGGSAGSFLQ